jgi:hypothetical protein
VIEPVSPRSPRLTVILPTRNRQRYCAAQLRFFRDCGLAHPIVVADPSGWREPAQGDTVHASPRGNRRYICRREVLMAEPREEIAITPDEMARVERTIITSAKRRPGPFPNFFNREPPQSRA